MANESDLWMTLREADQRLADAREEHRRELREADQRLADAYNESNRLHFEQLNENAKRTIEERGHFVSVEAYTPFQQQVVAFMASTLGASKGTDRTVSWMVAGVSTVIAVVSIIVAVVLANAGG